MKGKTFDMNNFALVCNNLFAFPLCGWHTIFLFELFVFFDEFVLLLLLKGSSG